MLHPMVANFLLAYPESPLLKDLTAVERAGLKPTPSWAVNRVVQYLMRRFHTELRVPPKKYLSPAYEVGCHSSRLAVNGLAPSTNRAPRFRTSSCTWCLVCRGRLRFHVRPCPL